MQTYTGRMVDPMHLRLEDVCIEDIAHHLAHICRYGGASNAHYSVAEHSILCSFFAPVPYRRQALLHDSPEAYLGDEILPIKVEPRLHPHTRREADRAIELIIFHKFGIKAAYGSNAAVKEIDRRIVVDETRELMASSKPYEHQGPPLGATIRCYSAAYAEMAFLIRFGQLFPEHT